MKRNKCICTIIKSIIKLRSSLKDLDADNSFSLNTASTVTYNACQIAQPDSLSGSNKVPLALKSYVKENK